MLKENYEGLRKQLDNGSLDIPNQITILEIAYNLEQQLQAYKQKEDNLREYCKEQDNISDGYELDADYLNVGDYKHIIKDLLQILNEGSDK